MDQLLSPADLIECGFAMAYEAQKGGHEKWRTVMTKLEDLRGNVGPHDGADNDVYFDLLLRQLEDEQAAYIHKHGQHHPHSRVRFQIQLTRYWLVSMCEMLRVTRNAMDRDHAIFGDLDAVFQELSAFRMMSAKQEPKGTNRKERPEKIPVSTLQERVEEEGGVFVDYVAAMPENGAYRVKPYYADEDGSIAFRVYDHNLQQLRTINRRKVSDRILGLFGLRGIDNG